MSTIDTSDGVFSIASLNCTQVTSASELCAELRALGADLLCLQNCVQSRVKPLLDEFDTASFSGLTVAARKSVFDLQAKDTVGINLLDEVLRRQDTLCPYVDYAPFPFAKLSERIVGALYVHLVHRATGKPLIAATADLSFHTHHRLGDSGRATGSLGTPVDGVRWAMSNELLRLLDSSDGGQLGLCHRLNCRAVIAAGTIAGEVNSAAYAMMHRPADRSSSSTGEAVLRVDCLLSARPRPAPTAGANVSRLATACFVASHGDALEVYACEVIFASAAAAAVDGAATRLEVGLLSDFDQMHLATDGSAAFEALCLAEGPPAVSGCVLTLPLSDRLRVVRDCPVALRLTWPVDSTADGGAPQVTLLARPATFMAIAPLSVSPVDHRDLLCTVSATASSLSPAEVEADQAALRAAYASDADALSELESRLATRGAGSGEPVATVSRALLRKGGAQPPPTIPLETLTGRYDTGCQDHIFFTQDGGLRLVDARALRAEEALQSSSTAHKAVRCRLQIA